MGTASVSDKKTYTFIADIGTTTIKASLCSDGPLATLSEKNAQSVFGLDVISRVLYAHHHGVGPLQQKVLIQLLSMLQSVCAEACVKPEMLSGLIVTGNTVMLHLVRGFSVQGFEMAPFSPVTTDAAVVSASSLFECIAASPLPDGCADMLRMLPDDTPVYFPPCIDAFLGADAVCAALYALELGKETAQPACNQQGKRRFPLLVADVGTNTEILLIKETGDAVCCSTAAGPAFEGGVLGGRFTGSELVHMLSELLKSGLIDETGLLNDVPASDLEHARVTCQAITQDAVRQLQLAKGAVCAAIETVLKEEGLSSGDVGSFVLCGNFGSALDAEEAERIGLFPAGLASVAIYTGNAAELGAQLLVSEEMRTLAKKRAASGKLIQLADSRFFARRYIERMNFGNEPVTSE